MNRRVGLVAGIGLCVSVSVGADDGPQVVPEYERDIAAKQQFAGPSENSGIKSVTLLGKVDLSDEFAGMSGRVLRSRELVIEPGGVVAVHQHDARPGLAYILEGEIVEHRNDHSAPLVRKQGDVAFENSGVTHWWENVSEQPVRALVVDIVKDEK